MSSLDPGKNPSASSITVFIRTGWHKHPPNFSFSKANVSCTAPQQASEAESVARHDEKAMIMSVVEFSIVAPHSSGVRAGTPNTGAFSITSAVLICAWAPELESTATRAAATHNIVDRPADGDVIV
mmetsp:Transcript_22489/g.47361  ORF Transcript_22489/g.47361 Transcript_22489/m.47361 type:complete len:126 (+) Transcript_22489:897-1274(+)